MALVTKKCYALNTSKIMIFDFYSSPMPARRIFSSAVAAAVTNQPPPSLKEEFLAFSKSHKIKGKQKKWFKVFMENEEDEIYMIC